MIVHTRAYARAGLVGNPSDGFYGRTISAIVKNWRARAVLYESPKLVVLPTADDRSVFDGMESFRRDIRLHGYYGGMRLVKAAIKRFSDYCEERGVSLEKKNFTIQYESNIPRCVGLGGSSAITIATLRALMRFYDVLVPLPVLPRLALEAETRELGIAAGLQDRVIQTYEGMVYMDFDRDAMREKGHGAYEPLDPALAPPLYLAYRTDLAEESGVAHRDVRALFDRGDAKVTRTMREIAGLAKRARRDLLENGGRGLGELMDANFDLRASIYNIGGENLNMVMAARSAGVPAKFAGSGGAIVGVAESEKAFRRVKAAMRKIGARCVRPRLGGEGKKCDER